MVPKRNEATLSNERRYSYKGNGKGRRSAIPVCLITGKQTVSMHTGASVHQPVRLQRPTVLRLMQVPAAPSPCISPELTSIL